MTDDIAKADNDRDALYAGYKKAVEGFLAMPVADMAQAAKSYHSTSRTTRSTLPGNSTRRQVFWSTS